MIRKLNTKYSLCALLIMIPVISYPQKSLTGAASINSSDLQAYVSFLAAPEMKGRANGEPQLEIALNYIVSQAKIIGLRPADGKSYLQPYSVMQKKIDQDKSSVTLFGPGQDSVRIKEPFVQLFPAGGADFTLEGEVVYAGYGIKADKYNYNDLENIQAAGKVLLIMNRSPMSEDGTKFHFQEPIWSSFMSIQAKLTGLMFSKARAILIVCDPKSGFSSIDQQYPGIANELKSSKYLKGTTPMNFDMPAMPRILFIGRSLADELLRGTGRSLEELQKQIDRDLKPQSFLIPDRRIRISETSKTEEVILNNVVAIIEGSDPQLKKEFVVFSAHADHIGGAGDQINDGADDDASGCAAILELSKAFQSNDRKPLRSLLFLWVTGEEIGLFGSQSYVNNPVIPVENTVADLNLDMIGRVKSVADTAKDNPMTGKNGVFIIADNQSKELVSIADQADRRSPVDIDYSLSGRNHPLQLFSRSDHYNFVRKDVPVLCFTTGLHKDYHTTRDVVEKIDFDKMEQITKMIYDIGFTIANRKTRIVVDNPYSKW